ncbi:hypothetical protein SAMN04488693_11194 [Arthrobacter subterraneus]|uniref:Uncharacterized protein n=1 Tax=Arthrobacter subterraneus TaxID=335973 RepID=A0A1G8KM66_9MICC|nr:hypothetical protein SAMN04488693_11194 [Arthrobacter subterraneus]
MKKWSKPARILFWLAVALIAFIVLRMILGDSAWFVAAIPGYIFVGYMANLGVQQVRHPPSSEPGDAAK